MQNMQINTQLNMQSMHIMQSMQNMQNMLELCNKNLGKNSKEYPE